MRETTITVSSTDGIDLQCYVWEPEEVPRGVVQVQHGLGEHAGRYRRFAEELTGAGYVVYGPDGRGSGRSAAGRYGHWGPDGWPGWVDDVDVLGRRIREDRPGLPVVLVGHSMGSFAAQQYTLEHSRDVDGLVLLGSTDVAGMASQLSGPVDLSAFNDGFEHRTGFEWLSRDAAAVDAYVADPETGFEAEPFVGIETLARAADPVALADVRSDLPVLILSGDADPLAGGGAALETVGKRYRDAGLTDVEVVLYPGARHELLHETNRDEVVERILAFLRRVTAR